MISLIVAMDEARVIGKDNALPWRIPADLKRFKAITMGKAIVMGRKTWESIGRALPGRRSIVLSRADFAAPGAEVVHSLDQAVALCADDPEIMIIGGNAVFQEALPLAERIYLTEVDGTHDGDVWFPPFDRKAWRETESQRLADHRFVVLERV